MNELITGGFLDVGVISAIKVTLTMGISSTLIATILGLIIGLSLERYKFPGKKFLVRLNRTLMSIPPVVIGLVVYMLLMRRGPLGSLRLLFTIEGMIIAQVIMLTPIMSGLIYTYASNTAPAIRVFAKTMGADKRQTNKLLLKEMQTEIYFCMITLFGRAISEVGSVMLVGGNIKGSTRTMTTAISLLKSRGVFEEGIVLGMILLFIAFAIQWMGDALRKEVKGDENY